MKSIEINGQTYPFRVGLRAIENFEIRTKTTLADFKGVCKSCIGFRDMKALKQVSDI
jgi:hypothetical protein